MSCSQVNDSVNLDNSATTEIDNFTASDGLSNLSGDDLYAAFSVIVYDLHQSLNELSSEQLSTKNGELILALQNLSETGLSGFADIHADIYGVDKVLFSDYFNIINSHLDVFSSPNFSSEYTVFIESFLQDEYSEVETRWFSASIAAWLGAGPCTQSVLGVIDAAASVATGILTSASGVGAVAAYGSATASYGNAFVNANECLHG